MSLPITAVLAAALAVVAVVSGWRGARPPDPMRGPRLTPWRLIMTLSAAVALLLLFQALRQMGFQGPGQRL